MQTGKSLRTIAHVDMDMFFVAVELLRRPELVGKPVVVGGDGNRGVVAAASYEARRFGVFSAMPSSRAKRLCPHAIFLPGDMSSYVEVSSQVFDIFRDYTPLVEGLSLDEAFLDVTGSQKLFGTGREIAAKIREQVEKEEGITCSVGLAQSKFIAKLASQHCKPNGMLEIKSNRILEFLHPLPVRAIWGVGPKTAESLERLGLHTVSDIAHTPRATLIRALGESTGASLYELAWGRDYRDVTPEEPDKSISAAETFSTDLDNPIEILQEFLRMTKKATARLREKGLFAKTISIKVRFADFKSLTRDVTTGFTTSTADEILQAARACLKKIPFEQKGAHSTIRLLGIKASHLITPADAALEQAAQENRRSKGQAQLFLDLEDAP